MNPLYTNRKRASHVSALRKERLLETIGRFQIWREPRGGFRVQWLEAQNNPILQSDWGVLPPVLRVRYVTTQHEAHQIIAESPAKQRKDINNA